MTFPNPEAVLTKILSEAIPDNLNPEPFDVHSPRPDY